MGKTKTQGNLFRSINHYHNSFYSYNRAIKARPILVVVSLLLFGGFVVCLIPALGGKFYLCQSAKFDQNHYLFASIVFEILVLLCGFWLREIRDKKAIEGLKSYSYETRASDLNSFKCDWINKAFGVNKEDYLGLANDIDQAMALWEKNQLKLSFSKKQLSRVFFIEGTPTRIFNAILAFSAATIALSIAGGATIDDIFDAFYEVKTNTAWVIFFLFPILIYLAGFMCKYLILIFINLIEILFANLDGLNSRSENRAKILILDLLRFYRPPLGKVRPKSKPANQNA